MDLGRWGQRKIQALSTKSKSLIDFLEGALENDAEWSEAAEGEERYVARDDFAALEAELASLANAAPEKAVEASFDALARFFEAGFWLKREPSGEWRARRIFILGRSFWPDDDSASRGFPLPECAPEQTQRGRGRAVLARFGLDSIARLRDSVAFRFSPAPGNALVVLTERGEPWAVDLVEAAARGFARMAGRPAPRPVRARDRIRI